MSAELLTVRYVGPLGACCVDPDGLGEVVVVAGETLDVPVDTATSLLEQPANWEHVAKTVKSSTKTSNAEEATN